MSFTHATANLPLLNQLCLLVPSPHSWLLIANGLWFDGIWDTWHFSCTPSTCAGGSLSSALQCVPLDSLCERLCNLARAEKLTCDSITDPQQVRFTIVWACQSALNCHHHFTAEPEPGPAEQDGHIICLEQTCEEAGATVRGQQYTVAKLFTQVGCWREHHIDWETVTFRVSVHVSLALFDAMVKPCWFLHGRPCGLHTFLSYTYNCTQTRPNGDTHVRKLFALSATCRQAMFTNLPQQF